MVCVQDCCIAVDNDVKLSEMDAYSVEVHTMLRDSKKRLYVWHNILVKCNTYTDICACMTEKFGVPIVAAEHVITGKWFNDFSYLADIFFFINTADRVDFEYNTKDYDIHSFDKLSTGKLTSYRESTLLRYQL